jgi:hypothetical protein
MEGTSECCGFEASVIGDNAALLEEGAMHG